MTWSGKRKLPVPSTRTIAWSLCALMVSMTTVKGESATGLKSKGNACEARLDSTNALRYYLEAAKLHPNDADLMVRIARQYRHLMSDAKSSKAKLQLGEMALQYGRKAVAIAPQDSNAQLSTAISYGKMLPLMSSREQVESSRHIKRAADKALQLDPANDLAWHILGRWNRGIAEIGAVKRALASMIYETMPTATHDDAVKCFEKAIQNNPGRLMHYIELGCTYDEMGRDVEARKYLEKGLAMQIVEKDDLELKRRGRLALAKLDP
jgi:tetratricopeptide (TPR) repeat protein